MHGRPGAGAAWSRRTGRLPGAAIPPVRGDVAALPFRSGAFDAVLADHVPDRLTGAGRVAQELARVCRPSGRIVVVLDGRGHQAELLRVVGETAGIGSSATTGRFTFEDAVEGGLAPAIEIVTSQLRRDQLVATASGPLMSAVQRLRPRIEPRLRGFVNWTTVLARSREAFEHALAEQPEWRITRETGVSSAGRGPGEQRRSSSWMGRRGFNGPQARFGDQPRHAHVVGVDRQRLLPHEPLRASRPSGPRPDRAGRATGRSSPGPGRAAHPSGRRRGPAPAPRRCRPRPPAASRRPAAGSRSGATPAPIRRGAATARTPAGPRPGDGPAVPAQLGAQGELLDRGLVGEWPGTRTIGGRRPGGQPAGEVRPHARRPTVAQSTPAAAARAALPKPFLGAELCCYGRQPMATRPHQGLLLLE